MVDHSYECGNRESTLWPYQTCDTRIVHDPMYDNGLAGRARARALHNWASRGPAGPAVAAAAGRQGSRFWAIGTALMVVCAACRSCAPRHPLGTPTQGQPRSRMRAGHPARGGHAARPALDASPSPRATGPGQARHQPGLDESHHGTQCTRCARSPGLKCQKTRVSCARKQRSNAQP